MEKFLETAAAVAGAVVGFFLGGCDGICHALLAFMIMDYLSGVFVAISQKKLSSSVGFKGISKKVLILIIVGVANIIDMQLLKGAAILRTATIFFYITNEGISILENAAKLGLKLPKKLKAVLVQLSDSAVTATDENKTAEEEKSFLEAVTPAIVTEIVESVTDKISDILPTDDKKEE